MSIIRKLMTAIRGHASDAGEALVDANALTILDQEIRNAKRSLDASRTDLTAIMAQRQLHANKVQALTNRVEELTQTAQAALNKGEEALALEVAERIAQMEDELSTEQSLVEQFDGNLEGLRTSIREAEHNLKALERQVSVVKATENVQKAQAAVASRHSGQTSNMRTAMDSLDRIKEKQALRGAQISAANQLAKESSGEDLDARLKAAGLGKQSRSANDVLNRLRQDS